MGFVVMELALVHDYLIVCPEIQKYISQYQLTTPLSL